jgi:phage major head subunit gpT-like protein
MLVTAATLDALRTSFKLDFNNGFKSIPANWQKIATLIMSSGESNTYGWIKDFPQFREWFGDRLIQSMGEGEYAIKNREFESTVGVKRTKIEDDTLGIYKPMLVGLGKRAAQFPTKMTYSLLAAGFETLCWDGQYYFDTDHPVGDAKGSTYTNMVAGDGAPWILIDSSQPILPVIYQLRKEPEFVAMTQPTDEGVFSRQEYRFGADLRASFGFSFPQFAFASQAPLTGDNYSLLREMMTTQVDTRGEKIGVTPDTIVVGQSNRAAAKQLFQAATIVGGGDNIYFKDVEIVETPYLP